MCKDFLAFAFYKEEKNSNLFFDSDIKLCVNIYEQIAIYYTSKKENTTKKNTLTNSQINNFIKTGYNGLITVQKITLKAYTMKTLYLFGLQINGFMQSYQI